MVFFWLFPETTDTSCNQGFASLIEMHILCLQQTMTAETGLSKEEDEEEDDTMQNTVVLFSNTDKFVLQQVRI